MGGGGGAMGRTSLGKGGIGGGGGRGGCWREEGSGAAEACQ